MTDPMTRIADALELIAVVQSRDSDGYATDSLRERILAQYTVPTVTVPVLPTTPEGNALVDELLTRKPAPTTADVLGSELRVGDVVVDYHRGNGMWLHWRGSPRVGDLAHWAHGYTYRVRLPRPEPSATAKAKCPTCRCMIVPGAACACCVSTSGDDPQLPSLDLDEEPSASGDGIARLRHELLEIGAHSWAVGELYDQPLLMASRIVSAINAAHANATRELRERCERAERERDEARAEFNAIADERDRAKLERDAAIARAEAAERVVEAANVVIVAWRHKAGVITSEFGALDVALEAFRSYDAARRDGGK